MDISLNTNKALITENNLTDNITDVAGKIIFYYGYILKGFSAFR